MLGRASLCRVDEKPRGELTTGWSVVTTTAGGGDNDGEATGGGEGVATPAWSTGPPVQADVAIAASKPSRAGLILMRRIMTVLRSAANDCRIRTRTARLQ